MRGQALLALMVSVFLVACSGSSSGTQSGSPVDEAQPTSLPGYLEEESLPRQCDLNALVLWTSRATVDRADSVADVVIRVDSFETERCVVDLSESPQLGANVEPQLTINPGRSFEVVLDVARPACDSESKPLPSVPLMLNGALLEAAVNTIEACGYELASLTLLDAVSGDCTGTDLQALVLATPGWMLVRNTSDRVCRLPELVGLNVDGSPWPDLAEAFDVSRPAVDRPDLVLGPGDLVGTQLGLMTSLGCDPTDRALLQLAGDVVLSVEAFETCVFLDPGPARPYLSSPMGALADFGTIDFDIETALDRLDPFSTASRGN